MRALRSLVLVTLVLIATAAAAFFLGMRSKTPVVLDNVRRFNRSFTNPRVMRTAGTEGASASVMLHVGRNSGRQYETPIGPYSTENGFLVVLPYGVRADWVRNVLAASAAELVHDGRTYAVDKPAIVATTEVVHLLPRSERRTLRLFKVEQCLRLRVRVVADDPELV